MTIPNRYDPAVKKEPLMYAIRRLFALVLTGVAAVACANANMPAEPHPLPALGSAQALTRSCTGGAGAGGGTRCIVVEVSCPELAPREVELSISEPAAGTQPRGTIVFGSGGNGTAFYLDATYGPDVRAQLSQAGFRLVDRAWPAPQGWYADNDKGLRVNACRYATLLTWIHDNLMTPETAFCSTGNSGGSAEVGYSLTIWGRGPLLDLAVPTGGPAVTRLDLVCLGQADAAWQQQCDAFIDDAQWVCQPVCTVPPDHEVCTLLPNPAAATLRADSVMAEDAVLGYPGTRVHFLYGTADCGPNVPSSMNWATAITSEMIIENVPTMPHPLLTSPAGRDAIVRVMQEECVVR